MKNAIKVLAACVTVMLSCAVQGGVYADPDVAGRSWYVQNYNSDGVQIFNKDKECAITPAPTGHLNILAKYGWQNVVRIGNSALFHCDGITSATIPDTVTSIGNSAFIGCTSLSEVNIPYGVKYISSSTFEGCSALKFIVIPETVTNIWDSAFKDCSSLGEVGLAEGLTAIKNYAFYNCDSLTELTIPDSVTSIGEHAFGSCDNLEKVILPAKLIDSIPASAFANCSSDLKLVPRYAETVSSIAWSYCLADGKAVIYKGPEEPAIPVTTGGDVTVPSSLGGYPVVAIGEYAFYECDNVDSVVIPEGVTSIGENAFGGCEDMERVTIPSTVTSIGEDAFYGCIFLKRVTIPAGVTSIEDSTFTDCDDLETVTILGPVTNIGGHAFSGCASLKHANVPNGVTYIGEQAFRGCTSLTRATIPDSVTGLGTGVFMDCTGLKQVMIGRGVTEIPEQMFAGCDSITSAIIPEGVKSIGKWAFWGCEDMESVAIPKSVTSIGASAFEKTDDLATVYVAPGETETVKALLEGSGRKTAGLKFIEAFTVTFDANGGSCETAYVVCLPKTAIGKLPEATKQDDTFLGWFTEVKGGKQVTAEMLVTSNITVYARWKSSSAYHYTVLNKEDIFEPYVAQKAQTLLGTVYDKDGLVGIIEIKFGKVNKKKGTCKVSGTITLLGGKKYTIKSKTVDVNDKLASSAVLDVKNQGTLYLAFGGTRFAGDVGAYHVQTANVGGNWSKSKATATVEVDNVSMFSGLVLADLLPTNEVASISRGKWVFAKATSVKWAKPRSGQTAIMMDATGKGLVVDTTKGKTNLSGLKLTYTPKKGTFKGSFKVYTIQGKLKKYTVNVNGVVIEGVGIGIATCKRPVLAWLVTVE